MSPLARRSLATLSALVFAAAVCSAGDHFQVTALAPDLLLLTTDQGSYSNNSLVFTGEEGVLLVDTHHASDNGAFEEFVKGLGLGTPRYIINTHRHVEHIGGNHLFGSDPIVVAHRLFPEKLKSGTFLFSEYPAEAFPDITFDGVMEIHFNGEVIRLVDIGGSHDDNEIMVFFTQHGIAHISSVVNGFNFPSVDSDGDALRFEELTRRLMTLLPEDVKLVSGHHGKAKGFDAVGAWQMLPAYADMMHATVEIVRQGLDDGKTVQEMQEAGVLDGYQQYAGSYVSTDGWIESVADTLTAPRDTRSDICKPIYDRWKTEGAEAAVALYRHLEQTQKSTYDFNEYVLMSIGSKLHERGFYLDSVEFLQGSLDIYPEAAYSYYTHYLMARSLEQLGEHESAAAHCRDSLALNPDFPQASRLLEKIDQEATEPNS